MIDGDSSRDIKYSDLYEKMGLKKENVWPYEGSDLHSFHGTIPSPWGYIELMVTLGEERDIKNIYSQFLVVPCRSVYNYILGYPDAVTLDAVASLIHLKLKYHNFRDDSVMISSYLVGATRIYKVLLKDWKECEGKVMEFNIALLLRQLEGMDIQLSHL